MPVLNPSGYAPRPTRATVAQSPSRGIEMWNRHLKHRMNGFWRTFPHNTRPEQAARWLKSYTAIWNLTRGW